MLMNSKRSTPNTQKCPFHEKSPFKTSVKTFNAQITNLNKKILISPYIFGAVSL